MPTLQLIKRSYKWLMHYTNEDLCRIPGHAIQVKAGLSGTWADTLSFFYSSVRLVGNFAWLPQCTVPSALVHCNQNEAVHQTIISPSMPCWSAAEWKHSLAFVPQDWWNWQIKHMCIDRKFSVQKPSEWRVFCIPVSNFAVFQHRN